MTSIFELSWRSTYRWQSNWKFRSELCPSKFSTKTLRWWRQQWARDLTNSMTSLIISLSIVSQLCVCFSIIFIIWRDFCQDFRNNCTFISYIQEKPIPNSEFALFDDVSDNQLVNTEKGDRGVNWLLPQGLHLLEKNLMVNPRIT